MTKSRGKADKISAVSKEARSQLTQRYLTALRAHLARKSAGTARTAQSLGRSAVASGLVTLDLAIMHEKAVVALAQTYDFTNTRNGVLKRAGVFFTQVLLPLEAQQRTTREHIAHLKQHNETLREHTAALAKSNRRLEREIARREAGELTILKGREHYQKLFEESQVMEKKLRLLTRQILSAQEEERKKISRELHDEVVQTLVGINVELAALSRGNSNGMHNLRDKITHTQRLVEKSVKAVHRFARELRPAVLDDLGLIPALHVYCKSLASRKKLKINLTVYSGVERLEADKRTVLFRVAQEALTNVARHARATLINFTISREGDTIRFEIKDNGKSFPVRKTLHARTNKRLGLVGMRERVEMVGGKLTIESSPGIGTTVRAEIPFTPKKN